VIEEKEIELTENEILMTRSMCKNTLASTNSPVATSILQKLSAASPDSPESMITEPLTMRNRKKLLRNIAGILAVYNTEVATSHWNVKCYKGASEGALSFFC
jgi:predicted MarR family transcription regulator